MPNTKSAKKRRRQTIKATARNKAKKSVLKTALNKFDDALHAGNIETIERDYAAISKTLDQAASYGIIHKNTASRKKSRLAKQIQKIKAG